MIHRSPDKRILADSIREIAEGLACSGQLLPATIPHLADFACRLSGAQVDGDGLISGSAY